MTAEQHLSPPSPSPAALSPLNPLNARSRFDLRQHPVLLFTLGFAAYSQFDKAWLLYRPPADAEVWSTFYRFLFVSALLVLGFYFGFMRRTYPLKTFFGRCDYRFSLKVCALYASVGLVIGLAIFLGSDDPELRATMYADRLSMPPGDLHAFAAAIRLHDVVAMVKLIALHTWIPVLLFPIVEELLFRGLVLRECLRTMSPFRASCVASALFAASHDVFLVGAAEGIGYGGFLFLSGLLSCYFARRSGSLLLGIATHAIHNGIIASVGISGHFFL